jgi:hypothetical protein
MMQNPVVAKTSIATPTNAGRRSHQALCTSDQPHRPLDVPSIGGNEVDAGSESHDFKPYRRDGNCASVAGMSSEPVPARAATTVCEVGPARQSKPLR